MTGPSGYRRAVEIRAFVDDDWDEVWPILEQVIRAGDTFCYDPGQSEAQARGLWILPPPAHVVVALDGDEVVGTANMYPNREGPGAHIASGNVMVKRTSRNHGVGRALLGHLLQWARRTGFAGVQFNAVAASNVAAVRLYESLGFTVIGTVPEGFEHPALGRVGLHVMFHDLSGVAVPDAAGDV